MSYLKNFSILFSFMLLLGMASCERKSCDKVVCGFRQACDRGVCKCIGGYEGTNCEILSRDKFLGTYNFVSESCVNGIGNPSYSSQIIEHPTYQNMIRITNMGGRGVTVDAYVDGNFLEIQEQNFLSGTILGQGEYNQTLQRIDIDYHYTLGGQPYDCTAHFQ